MVLIRLYLDEIHIKVHINKDLSDVFSIQNDMKQRVALSLLLLYFALECAR